jgi:tetratricopeptide (TPR) repeat protein
MKKEWVSYRNALKEVLDEWWENPPFTEDKKVPIDLDILYINSLKEDGSSSPVRCAEVCRRISLQFNEQGQWGEELKWAEQAYLFVSKCDAEEAIPVLNHYVDSLVRMGRYSDAEPIATDVFLKAANLLGAEHPSTLASVDNLGGLLKSIGDYDGAEPLHRRCLEARERTLGAEHPSTLTSVNNFGELLELKGDYVGADPLYRRSLEVFERTLGAEHPFTLGSVDYLGGLLMLTEDYDGSEPLYLRSLEACDRTLGAEHPFTLASLNNLGGLLKSMGDYDAAEPLYRRCLEAQERTLGAEHPSTLTSVNNLGVLLKSKGDYVGAIELTGKALAGAGNAWGVEHPNTARIAFNYYNCRFLSGAKGILVNEVVSIYEILESKKGHGHEWTQECAVLLTKIRESLREHEPT